MSSSPHPTDHTSLTLLQQVRVRNEAAWERLLSLYGPLVSAWCRRAGLRPDETADLVQNIFLKVSQNLDSFQRPQEGGTFRGWLRVIARNQIASYFRSRAGRAQGVGGSTAHAAIQLLPERLEETEDALERSGLHQRALTLIQQEFEETTWRAFWATAVEQRPAPEVAQDMGLTSGAVRQARYRVLRRLRQEFGDCLD